ncbi:MAG: hypothetical protein IJ761_02530 [Bacteroidales bacterium]|nr:hypothetical protein [Bacteroidales bacterium]
MSIGYPWYSIVVCLLIAAAYAILHYWHRQQSWSRAARGLLALMRGMVVFALCLLLLRPTVHRTVTERHEPCIVLLQDTSTSVKQGTDSAFSIEPLAAMLAPRANTIIEYFGDHHSTNIASAIAGHPEATAIVMASDGLHNRGASPLAAAERLTVPLYTIALGDSSTRRDAMLCNSRTNKVCILGSELPIEVGVKATQLAGASAKLTISQGNKELHSSTISYNDNHFYTTITATVVPTEAGMQTFNIDLQVVNGEATSTNNHISLHTEVVDNRKKILLLYNSPHPDISALKQAIESNANFSVEAKAADKVQGASSADTSNYAAVVFHNLPSTSYPDQSHYSYLPQLYVIGLQTDLARFNQLHTGLEIKASTNHTNSVTAIYQQSFSLFNADATDAAQIEAMPPLDAPFGQASVSPLMQTLFTARLGNIDTRQPLIAATTQGDKRRAFVWGEGLWRWRMADYRANNTHSHFDKLVAQLAAFIATHEPNSLLQVDAEKHYDIAEPIQLRAKLFNKNLEAINNVEMLLQLHGPTGTATYRFSPEADGYQLSLTAQQEGIYRYVATATYDGTTHEASGTFAVDQTSVETSTLQANHQLLQAMSQTTGGRTITPDQTDSLSQWLNMQKPTISQHIQNQSLLNQWWVLALILLLMCAEWALRKANGRT